MAYTKLIPQQIHGGRVEEISHEASHYLLSLPQGKAGEYRLAQLDDYAKTARKDFHHRPPVTLRLAARTSSNAIPGTWGFGFWNYPFGMSLGFSEDGFRLPALPNTAWFFGASEENYLSFQDHRAVANGFLAQTFRSPKFDLRLIPAGLALPFSRRTTRRLLGKCIQEDGVQLWDPAAGRRSQEPDPGLHRIDPTQWHRYEMEWRKNGVSFRVEDELVFESVVSPRGPLGLVIWIDNQYAAFTPEGKIGFGVLENPEPVWLEIKEIEIR